MRRYADELRGSRDALDAEMVRLLDAAEPIEATLARRPRRLPDLQGTGRSPAPPRWALRFALAILLLGATGAAASAALGKWPSWASALARHFDQRRPAPALPQPAAPPAAPVPVSPPPAVAPEEAPRPSAGVAVHPHGPATHPRAHEPAAHLKAVRAESPQPGEEKILAAVRALRRDGDPGQARRLVSDYLREQPNGALVEEARALEIEAAAVRRDADTRTLADAYLRRYPQGAFRGRVTRAVQAMDGVRP